MAYRKGRLSHAVREIVSDAISHRISDPRVNRFTSVTHVELSVDLRIADIHVSVMGTESEAGTTLKGLQSARGMIQSRLAKQLSIRHCPMIRFHLDRGHRQAIETLRQIHALNNEFPDVHNKNESCPDDVMDSEESKERDPPSGPEGRST